MNKSLILVGDTYCISKSHNECRKQPDEAILVTALGPPVKITIGYKKCYGVLVCPAIEGQNLNFLVARDWAIPGQSPGTVLLNTRYFIGSLDDHSLWMEEYLDRKAKRKAEVDLYQNLERRCKSYGLAVDVVRSVQTGQLVVSVPKDSISEFMSKVGELSR